MILEGIMAKAEYRSAIRSRKLINSALADLLQEKPLEKITVTDVVNRAQINRGTFYAHYADIPDVVNRLIQQTFSAIREALMEQSRPFADVPGTVLRQVQSILEEDLPFYRKIMNSSAASLMQEQLVEILVDYFLQNRDAFYSGSQEQYELMVRFCAGGVINFYRDWFSDKLPYSLSEMTQISETLIHSVIGNMMK